MKKGVFALFLLWRWLDAARRRSRWKIPPRRKASLCRRPDRPVPSPLRLS